MEKFHVEMLSKETISATMSRAPKEGRAVKRGLNSSYRVLNVIQLEILAIMSQYMCFNIVAALQLHTTFMNYDRLRTTSGHSSNLCSFKYRGKQSNNAWIGYALQIVDKK